MLDPIAVDAELERMVEKRRDGRSGREKANAEAAHQRAADLRKAAEMRQEHRVLWVEHFRRLAAANLLAARDFRRRARLLEAGE